jgi:hypothetical protein
MIGELKVKALLDGYRGAPPCKQADLEDLLHRLSFMLIEFKDIQEIDLNPVIVSPRGALTVDCRVRVTPSSKTSYSDPRK